MWKPDEPCSEIGRVLAPDTARPSEEELSALARLFWKARGCPEWLWGGMPSRNPLSARLHAREAGQTR